jgi:hypothetical protein
MTRICSAYAARLRATLQALRVFDYKKQNRLSGKVFAIAVIHFASFA